MGSLSLDITRGGISPGTAHALNGKVATGLIAAGANLATALALTCTVNYVGTVAAGTGVSLYAMQVADEMEVYNGGANALNVYPSSASIAINNGAAGAAYSLSVNQGAKFRQVSATQVVAYAAGTGSGGGLSFANVSVTGQTVVAALTAADTFQLKEGANVTLTTDAANKAITIAAAASSGYPAFGRVFVSGQSTVLATASPDTLQLVEGTGMTMTTNAAAKTVTLVAVNTGAWPVGSVFISRVTTSPATLLGYGVWSLIGQGQVLVGFLSGSSDFGTLGGTGGATGVAAAGTNSTATFTPSGTIDMTLYIPKGTLSTSAFTPSGSIAWPATAPSFTGTAATASASVNWPTGQPAFVGGAVTGTASVNWPAGNVSVLSSSHRHELPVIHTGTGAAAIGILPTATFGVGTNQIPTVLVSSIGSNVSSTSLVALAGGTGTGAVMMSNTVTAFATATWPASVPQAQVSVAATGSVAWPASVPQAVISVSAAGIISWPTGVPVFVGGAGTVPAQVFTGATGSGSAVFTGVAGTVPAQTFTGSKTSVLQPYLVVNMWERTA